MPLSAIPGCGAALLRVSPDACCVPAVPLLWAVPFRVSADAALGVPATTGRGTELFRVSPEPGFCALAVSGEAEDEVAPRISPARAVSAARGTVPAEVAALGVPLTGGDLTCVGERRVPGGTEVLRSPLGDFPAGAPWNT